MPASRSASLDYCPARPHFCGTTLADEAGPHEERPADMSIDRQFGWMWAQACELLDRADRMQREFVRYVGQGADAAVWEPPVDIQETAEGLHFTFALPGVDPDQINVSLDRSA